MKLLIVGGVAGGASAAARARRLSESAEIVLFERGPEVSFANCGLPYYVGGEIATREKLIVTTPERLRTRFKLDVRTRSSVEAIDRTQKTIRVRELDSNRVYEESYDKLILAPGAGPFRPPIPGIDLPGIYTLRNLQDVDAIKSRIDGGVKHAVVVGAGFIGLELAENFVKRGIATTVVELSDQILPPFDKEMTTPIVQELKTKGVHVVLTDSTESFEPSGSGVAVQLKSGQRLTTDIVIMGIGVRPENKLAVEAGLEIGVRGGIKVDDRMMTADPSILAVGDAIEVNEVIFGDRTQIPLAGPANRQGRIAADNVFGRNSRYRGSQGTAIVGVFGQTAAMTGVSEKSLRSKNRAYRKVYIHPANHAGYYPGAQPMSLKLLFNPEDGKILGAQAVGGAGVDKRIDVLAIAIQAGMTAFDLEEVELAYAPQFGSAKDPINMLGFVAAGLLRGDHPQADIESILNNEAGKRPYLLDVRTEQEFGLGSIPGAVNIPVDVLRTRLSEIPTYQQIAVFCQVGQRGYLATRILLQNGFDVVNLGGGYKTFKLYSPG